MKKKKIIIINHFRFIVFISILIFTLIIATNIILHIDKAYSSTYNYNKNYYEITIKKGDTLWQIAKDNNSANKDIRRVVYEIKKFNRLSNSTIIPGNTIKIPIE